MNFSWKWEKILIFDINIDEARKLRNRKYETIKMVSVEWFRLCHSIDSVKICIEHINSSSPWHAAIETHQMIQPHFFSQRCLIILNQYCLWFKFNQFSVALCRLFLPFTFDTWRYEHLIHIRRSKFSHSLSFSWLSVWCDAAVNSWSIVGNVTTSSWWPQ